MMKKAPSVITVCRLEVVVMPNGEILCNGVSLGWIDRFGKFLSVKQGV